MDFGAAYFPTHDGIDPGSLAALLEQRGQSAVLFSEHTHIPASRQSPSPEGDPLPRRYWHCHDPFVAATAAAAATSRLRVGTGVCLVVERDPIITAKQVASVDHLSGGRFEFGVGAGWNREEMRNHGTDPRVRMRVLHERVAAMREIWTRHEATYQGEFVRFKGIWSYPKPAQRPHPPVLVGGNGPTVLDRVLAFGDAWFPGYTGPEVLERITELHARAQRPVDVDVLVLAGDPDLFGRLDQAGVRRVYYKLPSGPRGAVERRLDEWDRAITAFAGG